MKPNAEATSKEIAGRRAVQNAVAGALAAAAGIELTSRRRKPIVRAVPAISVLINTYNYAAYVGEAIESVLAQTLPATEIIVVDDGSTDGTADLLRTKYGAHPRITILTQRNGGQMSAFVAGLERAQGDLLFFLDADDAYKPQHLESVAHAYETQPESDFVFTAYHRFGADNQIRGYATETQSLGYSLVAASRGRLWVGSVTSTLSMRRRLALTLIPPLREVAPCWPIRADDALIYGASLAGALKYFLAEPTVLYRVHDANGYFGRTRTEADYYAHTLRVESFLGVASRHFGIGPGFDFHPEIEFRSVERPTRELYKLYAGLIWGLGVPLMKRVRMRLLLLLHFRKLYRYLKR